MTTETPLLPDIVPFSQPSPMEKKEEDHFIINDSHPEMDFQVFEGLDELTTLDSFEGGVPGLRLPIVSPTLLPDNFENLYSAPFTSLATPVPIKSSAFDPDGMNIMPTTISPAQLTQPPEEIKQTKPQAPIASKARNDAMQLLMEAFKLQPRPTKKQIKALASNTNMSEQEVSAFFAQRRQEAETTTDKPAGTPVKKAKLTTAALEGHLSQLLDDKGGISDLRHASRLVKMMATEKDLESKSLLVHVIISTQKPPVKKAFLQAGVLRVLHPWLASTVKEGHVTFLIQILKALYRLPITVELLKESQIGKTVKKLESHSSERVKKWAQRLMGSWKDLVSKMVTTKPAEKEKPAPEQLNKEIRAAAVPVKKATTTSKLSGSNDFDDLMSSSAQKGKAGRQAQRRGVQMVESPETPKYLQTITKTSYTSKPISADDIRKAKRSKKLGPEPGPAKEGASASTDGSLTEEKDRKPEVSSRIEVRSISSEQPRPLSPPKAQAQPESPPQAEGQHSPPGGGEQRRYDDKVTVSRMAKRKREELERQNAEAQNQPKKKKKRVSWAGPDKLIKVVYFEKYLSSMNQHLNFQAQVDLEKQREREYSELQRKKDEEDWNRRFDAMAPTIEWRTPEPLDLPDSCKSAPMGKNSKEAEIQRERESKILFEIYGKNDIPPTPAEPLNGEADYDDSDVPLIPFEEVIPVAPETFLPPPQMPGAYLPTAAPMGGMGMPPMGGYSSVPMMQQQPPQQQQPQPALLSALLQDPSVLSKLLESALLPNPASTPDMYNLNAPAYGQQQQQPQQPSYPGQYQPPSATAGPSANMYNPLQPTSQPTAYDPKRGQGAPYNNRGYGEPTGGGGAYDPAADGRRALGDAGAGAGGGMPPYDNRRDFPMTMTNFPTRNNVPPNNNNNNPQQQQRDFASPSPQQPQHQHSLPPMGGVGGVGVGGGGAGGGGGAFDPALFSFLQQGFGMGGGGGGGGYPPQQPQQQQPQQPQQPQHLQHPQQQQLPPKKKVPCKYFTTREGCRNGDNCPWSHDMGGSEDPSSGGGGGGGGRGGRAWRGRR